MPDPTQVLSSPSADPDVATPSNPCVMVIFGASGDLTKRLLVPALYNLACDGLLNENFAVLGTSNSAWDDNGFRDYLSTEIKKFHTRKEFDQAAWDKLVQKFHYVPGSFLEQKTYATIKERVAQLDGKFNCGGNRLFYFAVAPKFFGAICDNLASNGFKDGDGWKRIPRSRRAPTRSRRACSVPCPTRSSRTRRIRSARASSTRGRRRSTTRPRVATGTGSRRTTSTR
jgi:hypothetical protein